jgi:hypothetical protein
MYWQKNSNIKVEKVFFFMLRPNYMEMCFCDPKNRKVFKVKVILRSKWKWRFYLTLSPPTRK